LKHNLNYGIIKIDFKIKKEESIKLNFQFLEKLIVNLIIQNKDGKKFNSSNL